MERLPEATNDVSARVPIEASVDRFTSISRSRTWGFFTRKSFVMAAIGAIRSVVTTLVG